MNKALNKIDMTKRYYQNLGKKEKKALTMLNNNKYAFLVRKKH